MAIKDRQLIQEENLLRARRDFAHIVLMRHWNAQYGGVYVEKTPGVTSNPYLENPDITGMDGKVYTKKNPALMTRELSDLMQREKGYAFRITSLRPLNPGNTADPKEMEALLAFERGEKERAWQEDMNGQRHSRYMAPLRVDQGCLKCHAKQGYRLGEIRGGISVSFPVGDLQAKLKQNLRIVIGLAIFTIVLLATSVAFLFRQLVRRLREARAQLQVMATTDVLTGLCNRSVLFQRLGEEMERHRRSEDPLACALLDVDHFKRVNDSFGHLEGDHVLAAVAEQLRKALRVYDVVGRYGGEEFLMVLPNADLAEAGMVAERVRQSVETSVRAGGEPVTASLGVALWRKGESVEAFLGRVDQALYRAKDNGRNRVEAEDGLN